jgi:7,8-dihydroneopterin aldolase/epimerase/oxygenase
MSATITIELNNLHFHAFHGLYAEEKKTGNEFEVNLCVSCIPVEGTITDLTHTVNYTKLYELLKAEMQKPRELLETFVMEVTEQIYSSFPQIKKVKIGIAKLHPPIPKFTGRVGVVYEKEF